MGDARPLVLLTNRFPFGTGEEYLEEELPHLAAEFGRIIIVPCMPPNSSAIRALPPGVDVLELQHPDHRRRMPAMIARGIRESAPSTARPVRAVYDAYFDGRAHEVADAVDDAVRRALGDDQPGVLYAYWFYLTARVAVELRRRHGWDAPLVSRAHGYDVNVEASPVRYLPRRELLLRECASVHPVSDRATRYLQATYPSLADRVSTRRLGTRTPPDGTISGRSPFTVVTCSMIRPLKRLDLVGEAVQILVDSGYDVRWSHVGDGRGRYASRLRERFGTTPSVRFMGYVPNVDLFTTYDEISPSVFVNVSTSEGVPVSVMEAMACGIPPLATDVGGTAELLGPLAPWALLPAELTADDLADVIESRLMLLGEREYSDLRGEARERWTQVASGDVLYRRFAADLASLCPA